MPVLFCGRQQILRSTSKMSVTAILVLEFIICGGWISLSNAQASVSLLPQERRSVCRGESISYKCIGNGTIMTLFSPPIVNESEAFSLFRSTPQQICNVLRDSVTPVTNVFVDFGGGSSFVATLTLFISDEQSEGQRSVHCSVAGNGMLGRDSANFSVLDTPDQETVDNIRLLSEIVPLSYSDDAVQAAVNISWDSLVNTEEFTLRISNMTNGYNMSTIRSFDTRVTVWLPFGTYLANLCVVNPCGKVCQNSTTQVLVERQSDRPPRLEGAGVGMDSGLLAAAVIAGVLGVSLIVAVIYAVIITIKWYKIKK